uniref:Uncharacterized protein n=1 Tax=Salix viminalis TaxID=40686 RepID=A0A6N2KLS1_SALVM
MFVSDRIIVDNYKEDDDVIDDERDNPSKGCDARPTANNKKPMMTLMLMLQKKKKKNRKENIAFRESCDGSASSKNINFSKPNKVVLFPFIKPSRLFHKKSTPPPAAANNADCFPGNTSTSCFCFKQPPTLESSSTSTTLQSQTSDPNHPDFTFDMLKSLIETNDFYSKECNPHSLDSTTTTALREGYGDSQGYWFLERLACRFSAMLSLPPRVMGVTVHAIGITLHMLYMILCLENLQSVNEAR